MPDHVRRGAPLMSEIVADPLSASCYRLFSGPGIQEYQGLSPDLHLPRVRTRARGSFGAASSGKPADVRRNPYLNLAANSLQIAQTVKDGSIRDCDCAGVRMRRRPPPRSADRTVFRSLCLFLRPCGPFGAAGKPYERRGPTMRLVCGSAAPGEKAVVFEARL